MTLKFCTQCGARLNDDAKFCDECGSKVQEAEDQGTYKNFGNEPVFELDDDAEERRYEKPKVNMRLIVICTGIFVVALIAVVLVITTLNFQRKKSVDTFEKQIESYESVITDQHLNVPGNAYYDLLQEAKTALSQLAYSDFDSLADEMREAADYAENTDEEEAQLSQLQANCEALKKYSLTTGDFERRTNQLYNTVSEAVAAGNVESLADLESQYEALAAELDKDNLSRITALKDQIKQIEISDMTDSEKKAVSNYESEAQQLISGKEYAKAIDKLESWYEYMETLELEREILKKESERKEQETKDSETKAETGDYILPGSSSKYLTDSDLEGLSSSQLRLARNEIYARHGRTFNDSQLQAYFESKSWYKADLGFSESSLSECERANVTFIKEYEE